MADISTQLNAIMNAVYGEEVRGSIHDAIDLINKVGEKVITIGTAVVDEDSSISGYYDESLYLNSSTSILWKCDGEKWVNMGTFKGADGEDGTDGASLTATSSKSGKITTVTISNASTGEVVNTFQVRDGADGSGGGGASSWDDLTDKPFESLGDDFTTDASSNLVLSSANIQKLAKIDDKIDNPNTKSNGQVLTYNGSAWVADDAPSGGHEMLSDRTAFENNTDANKVVDALVLKEWSNGYSKFVDFTITSGTDSADNYEPKPISTVLQNASDDANIEFFFELTENSEGKIENLTLAEYKLGTGTDKGRFEITVTENVSVDVNCRIKVTEF